jgi:hypothetical protein
MAYIFLDESGDLGFHKGKKTSEYFVITILATQDKKPIEKVVKKVHRLLRIKIKRLSGGVLHCYKEKPATRKKLLSRLHQLPLSIMVICLNKKRVYTNLQDEKHALYNYVVNILLDRIFTKKLIATTEKIILIASKRETNKFLNENFCLYLKNQAKLNHKVDLEIIIRTPSEEKGLQAVDFVSWAIFRKYENKDTTWYRLFQNLIIEEYMLFAPSTTKP